MNAKLELYRVFCQVAATLSFSKAADSLFLSQPAVSQSVRQLEEQLGTQLFLRSSKRVELTAQGKLLYDYVSSALGLIHSAEKQIAGIQELSAGELKLAAGDVTTKHLLLPHLETFHRLYPKVRLSIFNRTSYESLELLRAGKLDAAFVNLPLEEERIAVHWEFPIHDIFVAGERFRSFQGQALSLRQLASQPLILLERKANSRAYVERFFLRQGIELAPAIELASYDLLLEFAKINLGISCVVDEFSKAELEQGALFQIELVEPLPGRSVGLVCMKGMPLPPAAVRLLEIMTA